jgi:hypothetical protein
LKQIAGLIQGLTFREMQHISELLRDELQVSGSMPVTDALLKVADNLLGFDTQTGIPFRSAS